jgi:hypothetical protein
MSAQVWLNGVGVVVAGFARGLSDGGKAKKQDKNLNLMR